MDAVSQRRLSASLIALTAALLPGGYSAGAAERPLRDTIDDEIRSHWERQKITPAAAADDAAFLRRAYLDLVGTIPTHDEAKTFLADAAPAKRAALVDRLLEDPRFAANQTNIWDLTFFGRSPSDSELVNRRDGFRKWLNEKFAKNEPYDKWVRELVTADGHTADVGPVMFYAQYRNQPEETATAVSRLFLGMQLQCARCHNHPFDKWTQMDFYGFAGFFARIAFAESSAGGKRNYLIAEKSTGEVLFTGPASEQKPGQKGKPVPAKFLAGAVLTEPTLPANFKEPELKGAKTAPKPAFSRKQKLAEWVTAPTNPFFAKAVANRVWAQFLGRGLVHPVDDLGDNAVVSHPKLLKALAEGLKTHKFDLKWYIRELVNSRAYQISAVGGPADALPDGYERARIRPLSAEEMLSSIRVATGFDAAARLASEKPGEKLPGNVEAYMTRYLGEPLDGQGDFQAALGEHMFMGNGPVRQIIRRRKGNLADTVMSSKDSWEQKVDRMYLSVLSRLPKPEERKRMVAYISADAKTESAVEDALWVLVNCAEFRFNH